MLSDKFSFAAIVDIIHFGTATFFIKMSLLSKLRCITIDVTGTLIAYKGELGDYYCMAAKSVGLPCPDYKRMHEGFKLAYKEMAKNYPCFGYAAKMPNIVWWKTCVRDSFIRVRDRYNRLDIRAWHFAVSRFTNILINVDFA